jgi:Phosphodiester glycosidase
MANGLDGSNHPQDPTPGPPPHPARARSLDENPLVGDNPARTRAEAAGVEAPDAPPTTLGGEPYDQASDDGLTHGADHAATASLETAESADPHVDGSRSGSPDRTENSSKTDTGVDADPPTHTAAVATKRRRTKKIVPSHVKRRRRIIRRSLLAAVLLALGYVATSMYPYLTGPGTDTTSARVAEWARDHGLGTVVTWLENKAYQAPAVGGKLDASQLAQLQGPSAKPRAKADVPADIVPLAVPPLNGEGVWHPMTTDSAGDPIIEKAALRPDAEHTSALAYAVWMNQKALRFVLHPGYEEPGGAWSQADHIPADQRTGLVAAWNGGFKVVPDDALGGYYADGRIAVPLVDGKAAEVFYRDGSIKVGAWGRDETMGPDVVGVRENLSLLVDRGQVTVSQDEGSSMEWGYTINNSYFIARSGVGMTANGDMVYVSGSELSVSTLAKLLRAAGAVYGMELDINPEWITFMSFGGDPSHPTAAKLWDFDQPADRYFQPSTRDFVTVYAR